MLPQEKYFEKINVRRLNLCVKGMLSVVIIFKQKCLQVISTGKYRFNELKRSGALQHLASSRANTNVETLSDVRPVCLFSQSALCVLADDAKLPKKSFN